VYYVKVIFKILIAQTEFQLESLKNQELLLERQAQLERLCLEVLKNRDEPSSSASANPGWPWPIKDISDLDKVEEYLKSGNNFEQEVRLIHLEHRNSKFGVVLIYKILYNVLIGCPIVTSRWNEY